MTQSTFLRIADRVTIAYAVAFILTAVVIMLTTPGIVFTQNGIVGGDFLAFYTAGAFTLSGDALSAYDLTAFDERLKEHAPLPALGMMWQYPPTVFFLTAPFALLPYKLSYVLWCALGWASLVFALRHIGLSGRALRLAAFSVLCLNVFDNGQISLFTAALLFLAAYDPKNRWLIAGIAAGLLTIKPQLGILLPVAYLATGAWRTILVAIVTAVVLHSPSLLFYGLGAWQDFALSVIRLNADVTGGGHHAPPDAMTTLFGQLRMFGAPANIAMKAQYVMTATIIIMTAWVWRKSDDPLGKAALIGAGAILATPYGYAYEMAALLLGAVYLARQGTSLFSPARLFLIGAWMMIVTTPIIENLFVFQTPFLLSVMGFAVIAACMITMPTRNSTPTQRSLKAT